MTEQLLLDLGECVSRIEIIPLGEEQIRFFQARQLILIGIDLRMDLYRRTKDRLLGGGRMTLKDFANAHHFYGFHHRDGY